MAELKDAVKELVARGIWLSAAEAMLREEYVKAAMDKAGGSVTRAAARIGVHRNTLGNIKARIERESQRS